MTRVIRPAIEIRTCGRDDIVRLLGWAAAEGWNPGLYDATPFHVADPRGFLVAIHQGEPIGGISVVKYSADFGFLGLYIVRPEHRGHGVGIRLWNAGIEYLSGGTIGLDGVVAQQANYVRSGFDLAYRQIRFGGVARPAAAPTETVALAEIPFDRVLEFDGRFFPASRPGFLAAWIGQPESRSRAIVRDGRLVAVGVRRRCGQTHKIGPLFAEGAGLAERLLVDLVGDIPDQHYYLDVPEINSPGCRLAERMGLAPVFETARMYRGRPPDHDVMGVFGVTTFELG